MKPKKKIEDLKKILNQLEYKKPGLHIIGGVPGGCSTGEGNSGPAGCYDGEGNSAAIGCIDGDVNFGVGGCSNGFSNAGTPPPQP